MWVVEITRYVLGTMRDSVLEPDVCVGYVEAGGEGRSHIWKIELSLS
jgi:hypothetical protein